MGYSFFTAILDLARILTNVHEGVVTTSGSATGLIDTLLLEPNGHYLNGTVWVPTSGSSGDSRVVTNHAGSRLDFAAVDAAIDPGDRYMVASPDFPQYLLRQAINTALKEIGKVPRETTFNSQAGETEYDTTDCAYIGNDILLVEVAKGTSSPYYWTDHYRWRQIPGAPRKLVFDEGTQPQSVVTIRLTYLDWHAEMTADDDEISSYVNPDLLKWTAAIHAWRWRLQRVKSDEPYMAALLNEAQQKAVLEEQQRQAEVALEQASAMAKEAGQNQMIALNRYFIQRQRSASASRW